MLQIPKEIKDLLQESSVRKNLIIEFPNGEMETLDNSHIKSESMSFDESICSSQDLKFGLCESSVLKFTTINNVPNMKGMVIKASVGIECELPKTKVSEYGSSVVFDNLEESDSFRISFSAFEGMKEVVLEFSPISTYTAELRPEPIAYAMFEGDSVMVYGHHPEYKNSAVRKITVRCDTAMDIELTPLTTQYIIPLGTFTVHECKKQADMSVRNVVAYSNYLNFDDVDIVSPYEMLKLTAGERTNTDYTFDVCRYAFASVGQNVGFDFEQMGIVSTHITDLMTDSYVRKTINNSYNVGSNKNVRIGFTIHRKKLDISNSNNLLGYRCGNIITPIPYIKGVVDDMYNRYADRIVDTQYKSTLDNVLSYCDVLANYSGYNAKLKAWETVKTVIANSGVIDTNAIYHSGLDNSIYVPYKIDIELFESNRSGDKDKVVIQSESFFLFNVDNIDFFMLDFSHSEFKLPQATMTIPRIKNSNGAYVVDTSKLPNVTDVFKAMLELNGLYLVQDRVSGEYSFLNLAGADAVIYPLETLFPSESLYPGETDLVLKPENYFTAWYDDYENESYKKIEIHYTDDDDNEHSISVYDPIYDETFGEPIVTQVADSENVINFNIQSGKEYYVMADGLPITEIEGLNMETSYYDSLFVGRSERVVSTPEWENYSTFRIYVDIKSKIPGLEYNLTIGEYSREEIETDRKTLDLSDNYIIQNFKFEDSFIEGILRQCLANIIDVSYMPCEIDLKGLPYAQAGDSFAVSTTNGEGFASIILSRSLSGINALKDRYTSD